MYRSNLLVKNGRCLVLNSGFYRNISQKPLRPRLQEKYFIVEVKNDSLTTIPAVIDPKTARKSSINEIPLAVTKDHWMRVYDAINDIVKIYRNQARLKMEKVGIDEEFINSKKQKGENILKMASEKTPKKLKEFSDAGQEQWEVIKKSESFDKIKKLPITTVHMTKNLSMKIYHYWVVFENSAFKEKLVEVLKVCIKHGKKGGLEVYKFYKDVLNAPVPKLKH